MLFSNCYLFSTRVNLDNFIGILSSSLFSYSPCSCSYGRSWGNGNSCSYISIRGSFCSCLLTSLSTCCMSAESRATCMPSWASACGGQGSRSSCRFTVAFPPWLSTVRWALWPQFKRFRNLLTKFKSSGGPAMAAVEFHSEISLSIFSAKMAEHLVMIVIYRYLRESICIYVFCNGAKSRKLVKLFQTVYFVNCVPFLQMIL